MYYKEAVAIVRLDKTAAMANYLITTYSLVRSDGYGCLYWASPISGERHRFSPSTQAEESSLWEVFYDDAQGNTGYTIPQIIEEENAREKFRNSSGLTIISICVLVSYPLIYAFLVATGFSVNLLAPYASGYLAIILGFMFAICLMFYNKRILSYRNSHMYKDSDIIPLVWEKLREQQKINPSTKPFERDH